MKKLILKSSSLLILTFILSLTLLLFVPVEQSYAQEKKSIKFTPQIGIPGGIEGETLVGTRGKTTLLSRYIAGVYNYSFAVAGILAAIVLMGGGLLWLVSGGSQTKVSQAKDIIGGSIIGLGILFSAYLLLNTINPALLENKALEIEDIGAAPADAERWGCCECTFEINKIPFFKDKTEHTCDANLGMDEDACKEICKDGSGAFKDFKGLFTIQDITRKHNYSRDEKCGATSFDDEGSYRFCEPLRDLRATETEFDSSGWDFDARIKEQIPDMSTELAQFLNCMRSELPDGVGKISSISQTDYDISSGECNKPSCSPAPTCVHACESCHYGGGTDNNKSYAVDLGDEANFAHFERAAKLCSTRPYVENEGDHIHISVTECPKN